MYRGGKLYNQLPQDLVRKTKIQEFKRGAKEWVKNRIPLLPPQKVWTKEAYFTFIFNVKYPLEEQLCNVAKVGLNKTKLN